MKKLGAFLVGLGLVAGTVFAAATNTATSVNAVGFVKRTLPPNRLIMCSIGFSAMVTNSIDSIFDGQLTGGGDSSSSDIIIKWNPATQKYENAWKVQGTGTPYDNKWYVDDGSFPPVSSPMKFAPGDGFWIRSAQVVTQEVVFSGEVPNGLLSTNQIVSQMNLVAFPYSAKIAVNDPTNGLTSCATGGGDSASSDILILWDELNQQYVNLWLVQGTGSPYDGSWYYDDGAFPPNVATNNLEVSQGFWFRRNAGSDTTWVAHRPYSL